MPLKDPKDWKLIGQPVMRLDTKDKLTGAQVYGMDLKLPGMLNAAIKDCPVFGGKLKSFDAAAIASRPGVKKVVPVGDSAVAVVADTWWHAKTALDALPIVWDEGANATASSAAFAAVLKAGLDAPEAVVGNSNGDARAALAAAPRTIEAVYAYPHQNHATMETMNATARWTPTRCEVWTPTQNGEAALAATSEAAGLPAAQCEVYKINLGGGFGRRGAVHDWVRQAVAIAKELPGTPVKLIWSREEDMQHGRYHPVTMCKLKAGLDAQGNLTALHMRISGQSILAGVFPQNVRNGLDPVVFQGLNAPGPEASIGYSVPNLLIDHAMRNPTVPPGFWRGVNLNQNAVYLECFIDEVAHATKQDPLALRRKLMAKHPKHLAVLEAAAKGAGWGTPAPAGVYRGLAQTMGFGSYVAACAEVSVSAGGELKIHRIVAATDPGHAVNPQQVAMQVEGSFVYGLSAALFGECTLKDGRIEQTNFDTYPVLRLAQMPKVETILDALGRLLGRRRRADHRGGRAGGAERHLRRHRRAHPRAAAEEPEPEEGLMRRCLLAAVAAAPRRRPSRLGGGRRHPAAADGHARRCDARPRHRRQPADGAVPAVPQRAHRRGALPGQPGHRPGRRRQPLERGAAAAAAGRCAAPEPGFADAGLLPRRRAAARGRSLAGPHGAVGAADRGRGGLFAHAARLTPR